MTTTIPIQAGSLVVLSGLPGSGKSSLKQRARGFRDLPQAWISSDDIRRQLFGSRQELAADGRLYEELLQSGNDQVFAILRARLLARLSHGLTCIVDATSLNDAERAPYIEMARALGVPAKVLILDTPLEACIEADRHRLARVGEKRIRQMHSPAAKEATSQTSGRSTKEPTPPSGFMMTSRFDHAVISRDDTLELQLPQLQGEDFDVLGDVHGLLDETLALLERAGWCFEAGRLSHPQGRKLLVLGDFVDRGDRSVELIRLLKRAVADGVAQVLKGNHEKKLVRLMDALANGGVEKWSSRSNAETGMELLKQPDAQALVEFLRGLPPYRVLQTPDGHRLAFVHGNIKRFDAELTSSDECIFGHDEGARGTDSDAQYEDRYALGLNTWTVFRGHIPQTSEQEHIFSLERTCFQKGELVLLRLDELLTRVRAGATYKEAFAQSIVTQRCDFDYKKKAAKWELHRALDGLVAKKLATVQYSPDKVLRVYKYAKRTFWENAWAESPWLLKARGVVLDVAGNIVSHPFDKTFNLHENGAGDDLPGNTALVAALKLNGHLGIISAHPVQRGKLLVHTQGSFEGDHVQYIKDYLAAPLAGQISKYLSRHDVSLMFEVLHPQDPHIIEATPEDHGLWLIGVRGKRLEDQPWTEAQVDEAAQAMGLRRPRWFHTTKSELLDMCLAAEGERALVEGWMARADTPQQEFIFKLKTPYYLTTKFLGRLSSKKISHLYGNPRDFKKTVDEEFFPLVDLLVERFSKDSLLAMSDTERVSAVRQLIREIL